MVTSLSLKARKLGQYFWVQSSDNQIHPHIKLFFSKVESTLRVFYKFTILSDSKRFSIASF
jgi:hypothetical protein